MSETFAFCIIIWYSIGMFGCVLGTLSDLMDGIDYKVNDFVMNVFVSVLGPLSFTLGLIAYISNNKSGKFNKTLIKGKK